jgi:hypothetical protein
VRRVEGQPFRRWAASVLDDLPPLLGAPLRVDLRPSLTASGGRLLSNETHRGRAVFAASFIRKREIVLEEELVADHKILRGILLHELFHFAWVAAGNDVRRNYAALLSEEISGGARAELGESSEVSKSKLAGANDAQWKHYVCESFCDTAAWYFSGAGDRPARLARRWRSRRAGWFRDWTSLLEGGLRL